MPYSCRAIVIGMAAGFQDVVETDEIAFDVSIRVRNGVANASLCCQIHNNLRLVFRPCSRFSVKASSVMKSEISRFRNQRRVTPAPYR